MVPPMFDPGKIFVHFARRPAPVSGSICNRPPIAVVRPDNDHRVMRRAPAHCAGARIVHPAPAGVSLHNVFWILFLALLVFIMTNVEVKTHLLIFRGATVEDRHLIVPVALLRIGLGVVRATGLD